MSQLIRTISYRARNLDHFIASVKIFVYNSVSLSGLCDQVKESPTTESCELSGYEKSHQEKYISVRATC